MLSRLRQVSAKLQTAENEAVTLTAADANILAYSPKMAIETEMTERNPVTNAHGRIGPLPGKTPASFGFSIEMSGSGTPTTEPGWSKLLKACGVDFNNVYSISIGAVSDGPFQHGETIEGGTSGALGRVVINTANGATAMYFVPVGSGDFQSGEVITGETSGATVTTSSTPSAVGKVIQLASEPDPEDVALLTMGSYEGGVRKLMSSARGTAKFKLESGKPAMIELAFNGVYAGIDDLTLPALATPPENPPTFLSASFSIGSYAAILKTTEIDLGVKLAPRDDVNRSAGIMSYQIVDRDVKGSFDPEMALVAAHDFFSLWHAGTEAVLDFTLGTVTGHKFRFYAPRAQYIKVDDGDRDGIAVAETQFSLNKSLTFGNDEICILCL